MTRIAFKHSWRRRSERGSTFLIVLSILSILVIAAATLTYTTGLEVRAAGNFAQATQARMAALTGLPAGAAAIVDRGQLAVAHNQRWASPAEASSRQLAHASAQARMRRAVSSQAVLSGPAPAPTLDWMRVSQAMVHLEDEGGKLSLNSLSPWEHLRTIEAPPPTRFDREDLRLLMERVKDERDLDGMDPARLADAIVRKLHGADGRRDGMDPSLMRDAPAGDGAPDLMEGDPRRLPEGDDEPFISLGQLFGLDGMPEEPESARKAFQALSTVLTVYSQSRLAFEVDGRTLDCLDANAASPRDIYETLRAAYPDAPSEQLKQWAVNVVDWRDEDRIPTIYPGSDESAPILGIEVTPFIYEVWPESLTHAEDGDDGQYFELFNPWDEPINVDRWTVQIGLGGGRVTLNGIIEPRGFLVVTDDLDQSMDPEPEIGPLRFGSFFDIFGEIGDGRSRRILVDPMMDLPDNAATLYLRDAEGNLMDYFSYAGMALGGVRRSAQRGDPRIRSYAVAPCSPLAVNPHDASSAAEFATATRDRPFASPAGLFRVFSGWAEGPVASPERLRGGYPRLEPESGRIDARLLDIFAVTEDKAAGFRRMDVAMKRLRPAAVETVGPEDGFGLQGAATVAALDSPTTRGLRAEGRLNINTASRPALLALPGMNETLADRILEWRASYLGEDGRGVGTALTGESAPAPFPSLSAFALNPYVWEGWSAPDRLGAISRFANLITTNSQVFLLQAQNQTPPDTGESRPSISRMRSLVLIEDDGRANALNWRFVRP